MRGKIDIIEQQILPTKKLSKFEPGDTVEVYSKIREQDTERVQIFDGVVISISGSKGSKTFTVRKIIQGIGVERIFPYFSPNLVKVVVKRTGKVRRSKLYYLRGRIGRQARIKEVFASQKSEPEKPSEKVENPSTNTQNIEPAKVKSTT
ncbi:MAG: 50S ribosomal protein L19 [Planctomycetes bacterium]|nr:50S ribosomal protein L19 [Planctomycetota bacterium]